MTLRQKQSLFALNISYLIIWAVENGYEVTLGEAWRTVDQQRLYFEGYCILKVGGDLKLAKANRKSKTMESRHLYRLAQDLNVFRDGNLLSNKEDFKELADYWRHLHQDNISGYDWDYDYGHFEMKK